MSEGLKMSQKKVSTNRNPVPITVEEVWNLTEAVRYLNKGSLTQDPSPEVVY